MSAIATGILFGTSIGAIASAAILGLRWRRYLKRRDALRARLRALEDQSDAACKEIMACLLRGDLAQAEALMPQRDAIWASIAEVFDEMWRNIDTL